jgi:hypothetical protein
VEHPGDSVTSADGYPALILNRRIRPAIQHIDLRVPEVYFRLVVLGGLLLLPLDLSEALLLLISDSRLICGFATNHKRTGRSQCNELKLFHI